MKQKYENKAKLKKAPQKEEKESADEKKLVLDYSLPSHNLYSF